MADALWGPVLRVGLGLRHGRGDACHRHAKLSEDIIQTTQRYASFNAHLHVHCDDDARLQYRVHSYR
jgi:hypothetical protein